MWQVLLAAAAAAGSGILAKKFMNPTDTDKPISDSNPNEQECVQNRSLQLQDSIFPFDAACQETSSQRERDHSIDGDIFRFKSTETGFKELKKKNGSGFKGLKKNWGENRGKRIGSVEGAQKSLVLDQRGNGGGRRVWVCLKKRKTGKNAPGKCESCASKELTHRKEQRRRSDHPPKKDNSFGWGVGVGIMYMMSAGKSEISRLNMAMDETTKLVQDIKAEISRRKGSGDENVLVGESGTKMDKMQVERSCNNPLSTKQGTRTIDKVKIYGLSSTENVGCASTVWSDEQQPEVLEMDQLEAELECELQKLPGCATEGSGSEDLFENANSYQCSGVLPAELDKKLSNLLIEQQENQIFELEHALNQAQSKLHEKEAELQALKNCVKRLTEFSLTTASDEEIDEDMKTRQEVEERPDSESIKSVVGMKRVMGYESYSC